MYRSYDMMEEGLEAVLTVLFSSVPTSVLGIVSYVLTALALYALASRRGIGKAWLSWVPVLNVWILGSLSDQYRYVVKGEVRSKRKSLIVLNLLTFFISLAIGIVAVVMVVDLVTSSVYGAYSEDLVMGPVLTIVGLALPLAAVSIAAMVIRFMALYDVYKSTDPENSVLYLVLSILFGVTEPFFLFFNRNKDGGMPPRRAEPVYEQPACEQSDYQYEQPRSDCSEYI